jgi:hypothetical protein
MSLRDQHRLAAAKIIVTGCLCLLNQLRTMVIPALPNLYARLTFRCREGSY